MLPVSVRQCPVDHDILTARNRAGTPAGMAIFKIFRTDEWQAFRTKGQSEGSPDDLRDGFIHMSTAEQVLGTLSRHFGGEDGLWLLEIDESGLGADLRWEVSRVGASFPHLYRPLAATDIARAEAIRPDAPLPFGLS